MTDPNGDAPDDAPKVKLSFGFTKQIKSKVIPRTTPNGQEEVQVEMAEVTHIENGLING